jgi:hypothetical protein
MLLVYLGSNLFTNLGLFIENVEQCFILFGFI